jgi:hypothetical protein
VRSLRENDLDARFRMGRQDYSERVNPSSPTKEPILKKVERLATAIKNFPGSKKR